MEEAGRPVRQAGALWHASAALRGLVQRFGENATPALSCPLLQRSYGNGALAVVVKQCDCVMVENWRCVHLLLSLGRCGSVDPL
jgi:hypothetical protein